MDRAEHEKLTAIMEDVTEGCELSLLGVERLRADLETFLREHPPQEAVPSYLGASLMGLVTSWAALATAFEGEAAEAFHGCGLALKNVLENEQRRADYQRQARELDGFDRYFREAPEGEAISGMVPSGMVTRHPEDEYISGREIEHFQSPHGELITNDVRGTLYFHLWIHRHDDDGDLAEWLTKWNREESKTLVESMTIVFAEPFAMDNAHPSSVSGYGARKGEAGVLLLRWPLRALDEDEDQDEEPADGDEKGWVHFREAVLVELYRAPGEHTHAVFEISETWASSMDEAADDDDDLFIADGGDEDDDV